MNKIRTALRALAKKNTALRKIMRGVMYACRRICYILRGLGTEVSPETVVFEAYNGKSYACSPKAVYEYMLEDKRFTNYIFVWIFKEPEKYAFLQKNRNTYLVKYRSSECERVLNVAKYWIFNYRALDHWVPKKEQVYVQCWHGTPLKRLGYDIENSDNAMNSQSEIRAKYRKDAERFRYLLSPCRFATERFVSAWNLREWGREDAILEVGYPRNDFLVNHSKEDVQRIREVLGLSDEKRGVILYAPTWRDNQHDSSIGYTYESKVDFDYLRRELGGEYIILFRAHYLVANSFDFSEYEGFVYDVSEVDDINELYVISDMLVTDYSSVFFDYAILEKPIIFYMYDLEEYRDEVRGFYLGLDELPGTVVTDEEGLVREIRNVEITERKIVGEEIIRLPGKCKEFNMRFNNLNDGRASERFVRGVITGV